MRPPPLHGVRVLDFTTFLSGPFCTQIFGDLGAEVIKVEPFDGDSSRSIPPHFVGADSAYFLSTNRNKQSIALNLKTAAAVEVVRRLVGEVDIVVENYRPGVCKKLGLDPEQLRAVHPKLIWVSISGFGQTGPWRDRPAYDMTAQALSGVMSLTGEPGHPAVRLGIPGGDLIAGMYACIAALAALSSRNLDGQGQTIDVAMLDSQLTMLSYQAQYHLVSGAVPGPQGARHDSIPTYRSFIAGDGRELVVTANTERMWVQLCEALQLVELPERPEFASQSARLANRHALWTRLEPAFLAKSAGEWVEDLSARGVPAAPIKNVAEAIADARVHGREMIIPLSDGAETIEMVNSPMKLEGVETPRRYPPRLSGDAQAILGGLLGMSAREIDALSAAGALLRPKLNPEDA